MSEQPFSTVPLAMERETTIQSLFKLPEIVFSIPPYQRAYAWEAREAVKDRKQVCQFLDDLQEHPKEGDRKSYFLGHFLFERGMKVGNDYFIIDGQQRLTTVVIFFSCISRELAERKRGGEQLNTPNGGEVDPDSLRRTYVMDEEQGRKLHTVGYDDDDFRSLLMHGDSPMLPKRSSGARLMEAFEYMAKRMHDVESTAELIRWVELVETAVVTTFEVKSKEQSTQIFAFQNDRGKDLTNLEKLKAYLMHVVYVHSPERIEKESIEDVERKYAEIYQLAEEIRTLKEDQVLAHHLTAFLAWTDNPVDLLKKELKKQKVGAARVEWIREFCGQLLQSFQNVKQVEGLQYGSAQHERLIGDVLHLNAGKSWPLLIKLMYYHAHELAQVSEVLRLMEITLYKLEFMDRKHTNYLPNMANSYQGNVKTLEGELRWASQKGFKYYWEFNDGIREFLERPSQYDRRTRYMLWKYENHLRANERGVYHLSLQEYLNETEGQSLDGSIEHIMPQQPENLVHSDVFKMQYLNSLGNLVLMTRGRNSSLKNKLPLEKAESLEYTTPYLSQQAVVKTIRQVRGWGEEEIKERKKTIVDFAIKYWRVGEELSAQPSQV